MEQAVAGNSMARETTAQPARILVAGSWVESPNVLEVRTPGEDRLIGTTYEATSEQVEEAIKAAVDTRRALAELAPYERSAVLRRVADGIQGELEDIALALSAEAGKPIKDARTEVQRTALAFRVASEEAERLGGEVIDLGINAASKGRTGITRRFPAGVVAGIVPFNLPISLGAHKLAPAMAAGCPIVVKIPSEAPLAALRVAAIIDQAGALPGSVSIMPMSIEVGDQLVTDPRFAVLSFTGSPRVGWAMKARAGKKRVVLELGGNAGAIVDRSADLEWAAKRCAYGGFKYAGQTCISVQRVYIDETVWEPFVDHFLAATRGLQLGDPAQETSDIGPVISKAAAERVRALIDDALAGGATLLHGEPAEGTYIPATVLTDVPRDARLCREEAFGPVVILDKVGSFEDGIKAINDSVFGLQAGVFTARLDHVMAAYRELEVGGVIANDSPTYRVDHMPYGGLKDSGLGREGIRYAIEDMTELRLLVIARPE